jgi:hypothetical protein
MIEARNTHYWIEELGLAGFMPIHGTFVVALNLDCWLTKSQLN